MCVCDYVCVVTIYCYFYLNNNNTIIGSSILFYFKFLYGIFSFFFFFVIFFLKKKYKKNYSIIKILRISTINLFLLKNIYKKPAKPAAKINDA
jgi:hypothetical protein